ncbi:MAG TPA: PadR family transcriptional regulator [Dehalococcoidia bacterium]|nr:PadR family transcriptional regulator [Dehalococcoidia bacterium]
MFHERSGQRGWDWERKWQRWASGWGRAWERRERVFGRGDLKYVILDLLREQPRHGYDIIRELEGRFSGFYTPSAGAVYPILQLLEDMGAVTVVEQDGRKVYTITDEGRRILAERQDTVDAIAGRVRNWFHGESSAEVKEVMREMAELVSSVAALVGGHGKELWNDPAKLRRIRDLLARTRDQLRDIVREAPTV